MERLTKAKSFKEADLTKEYGYSFLWERLKALEDIFSDKNGNYDIKEIALYASVESFIKERKKELGIENGMIVGAESYDSQCKDVKEETCVVCKEKVSEYNTRQYPNGDIVCDKCKNKYLTDVGDDFIEDFIQYNEEDFYLRYAFEAMSNEEKLKIVKAGAKIMMLNPEFNDVITKLKVDYCSDDSDFLDFVDDMLIDGEC